MTGDSGNDTSDKVSKPSTWPFMNVSSLTLSFATKLATASIIWGWGYYNFSIAWLIAPIAFSVWKAERKRDNELRAITAQASVLAKEKELIVGRIDELPSWVYFPDFDRAEWLNRVCIIVCLKFFILRYRLYLCMKDRNIKLFKRSEIKIVKIAIYFSYFSDLV